MVSIKQRSGKQKIDHLDNLWRKYIHSYGQCEAGSLYQPLTWSHIIGRTYLKVRWDPRNTQCIGALTHATFTDNPLVFSRFVDASSCGRYIDTMMVQAHSTAKPDYDLWKQIFNIVKERNYTLPEAREWLGDNIMLTEYDILKLD